MSYFSYRLNPFKKHSEPLYIYKLCIIFCKMFVNQIVAFILFMKSLALLLSFSLSFFFFFSVRKRFGFFWDLSRSCVKGTFDLQDSRWLVNKIRGISPKTRFLSSPVCVRWCLHIFFECSDHKPFITTTNMDVCPINMPLWNSSWLFLSSGLRGVSFLFFFFF